jgi:hypothetical protein
MLKHTIPSGLWKVNLSTCYKHRFPSGIRGIFNLKTTLNFKRNVCFRGRGFFGLCSRAKVELCNLFIENTEGVYY